MKQEYPKWLYHATEPARIVASREEHEAMGPEWKQTPTECAPEAPRQKPARKRQS